MSSGEPHALVVQDVARLTRDAVTVTFHVPHRSRSDFRYLPGQYLMARYPEDDDEDGFRSYSICQAPPLDGSAPASVRIAVKLLGPGGFGEFAHTRLRRGDVVDVLAPTGRFHLQPARRHLAFAAGSGITPMLAMAEAALRRGDEFALVYGNRSAASTMFAAEIADLRRQFLDHFAVVHVLSREVSSDPVTCGRIGSDNLPRLLQAVGCSPAGPEIEHYLCGPAGMVRTVRSWLVAAGVERRRIHSELFCAALPVTHTGAVSAEGK
jgi:ring-1,2-phenylacetyl-CoA epoxidase subunit PaaE